MQVGEVERFVGAEEARGGEEGLAFMVAHVGPFAEIGLGNRFGAADTVSALGAGVGFCEGGVGGLTVGGGARGVCRS